MSMIDTPMTEALSRFLDVDVARHKLITSNLANIDTPGYRTRDLDFGAELRRAGMQEWENGWEFSPMRLTLPRLRWCGRCAGCWSVPTAIT